MLGFSLENNILTCIEALHWIVLMAVVFLDSVEIMPINILARKFDGTVVSFDDLCSLLIFLIVKENWKRQYK